MNETYEATHLSNIDMAAHRVLQRLLDLMQENEVAHFTVSVEWIVLPASENEEEIREKASMDIQVDGPDEIEIEGDPSITKSASAFYIKEDEDDEPLES